MLFICKSTKPRAVAPATSSIRLSHSGPLFLCTDTSGLGTIWPGTAPRAQSPLKSFKLASPKPVSLVCLPSYGNHKIVLPIPTLLPPLEQVRALLSDPPHPLWSGMPRLLDLWMWLSFQQQLSPDLFAVLSNNKPTFWNTPSFKEESRWN